MMNFSLAIIGIVIMSIILVLLLGEKRIVPKVMP